MQNSESKLGVLHIVLSPGGGVWSMLRELVCWQRKRMPTAIGICFKNQLPKEIMDDIEAIDVPTYFFRVPINVPHASGIFLPPLKKWMKNLLSHDRQGAWITHFHSGARIGLAFWPSASRIPRYPYPSVNTYHGVPPPDAVPELRGSFGKVQQRLDGFLSRKMQQRGVQIVALTPRLRIELNKLYGINEDLISIISNGVAAAEIQGCPRLRANLGKEGRFTIGFIGSIDRNKGWDACIRAVNELVNLRKNFSFLIIGDGPEKDELKKRIDSMSRFVSYLGSIPNAGKTILPKIDTLVLPSHHEGQPMAILEAFACSVPVIASAVGGIPDTITHGKTGFLIDNLSSGELAHYASQIIASPDLHRQMSLNCYDAWRSCFRVEQMGEAYSLLYKNVYHDRRLSGRLN